jgi:hypothetical protein
MGGVRNGIILIACERCVDEAISLPR